MSRTHRYTIVVMERQPGSWTAEVEDEDGGLLAYAPGDVPRQLVVQAVHAAFEECEDTELP